MDLHLPDAIDLPDLAAAAGYANVDQYVRSLIERDKDRLAIQAGLDAMRDGRTRPFDEFDAEFRKEHGLPPVA